MAQSPGVFPIGQRMKRLLEEIQVEGVSVAGNRRAEDCLPKVPEEFTNALAGAQVGFEQHCPVFGIVDEEDLHGE